MVNTIRGLNKEQFRRFKAEADKRGETIAEALHEAMLLYRTRNPRYLSLADLPTKAWGPGTENTSQEIDDIIAGVK